MKRSFFLLTGLCLSLLGSAQTLTPVTLNGLNADCIYQKGETLSTQMPLDNGNWVYYSTDVKANGGLTRNFTSSLYGVPYALAAFDGPNVLRLTTVETAYASGKITFAEQQQADMLFILGLSASGKKDIALTINYSDGTTEKTSISFHDWYGGQESSGLWKLGRLDRSSNSYDSRLEFGLFEAIVPVNSAKRLTGITCQAGSGDGYSYIFAVTAAQGYTFANSGELFLINNSHLDTQWNWDVKTTIESYIKSTLNDNIARLKAYPTFRFNFEGAQKYQWMKEYYPTQYEQLKAYVAEGRWNPSGGAWDANEAMISSAESVLRNLLYGQTFYKREFGKKGGLDIMLPDCFGFPASLPSIAAHCGFIGFHTQKLSWGSAYSYSALPAFGKWRGIDGNEIYCILKPGAYDATFNENLAYSASMLADIAQNEKNLGVRAQFRYTGRMGDRGGALSDENASWLQRSIESEGPVKVKLATPTEIFEYMAENDHGQYPVVDHELPMREHGVGCYTSQTMMKYWNRRNELTADAAERSAVAADWLGTQTYPYETLTDAWHRVIWHQFHDDLPGTCIPRAYGYSRNDEVMSLMDFLNTVRGSVSGVAERMDTRVEHTPVVVYNPLSIEREDIVEADIASAEPWTAVRVTNADGEEVPAQLTRYSEGRQHFIFAARVPSMGYATFDLQKDQPCTIEPEDFSINSTTLESQKYRVTLNASTGDIKSLYDKEMQREMFSSSLRLALMACSSTSWPSWEIPYKATQNSPIYVNNSDGTLSITIAEDGPLRKSFRIERTRLGSTFVQYIRLTSTGSYKRVDVENEVDWQSRGYLLKLEANLRGTNNNATYDNSLGFLSRGLSTDQYYEYCGHQWADQSTTTGRYGLSILNDCKYGWDKPTDGRLRLSLIYSPEVTTNYTYQANQDLGLNQFRFSLFSHEGKVGEQTQWQSDCLNQPLMAFVTTSHDGRLGKAFSFAQVDNDKVAVRALKRAEDSDLYIIRFHELTGEAQSNVSVTFPTELLSLSEVNGIEETIGTANFEGSTMKFDIGAFGIKTFALQLKPAEKVEKVACLPVDVTYTTDLMSLDAKRGDGLASAESLFPGELFEDVLTHEGIPFAIGPRDASNKNVVQCQGQSIDLPAMSDAQNDSITLHLLAFSLQSSGSEIEIDIDGEKQSLDVAYFKGNIGDRGGFYAAPVFRPENVAFTATHSHNVSSKADVAYDYMYLFHYKLRIPRGSQKLTLPSQTSTYIAAFTLEDGPAYPVTPLLSSNFLFPTAQEVAAEAMPRGEWLIPSTITASGYTNDNERPKYAADGNSYTKWCDNASTTKWIQYTFPKEVEVRQWEVLLAGIESSNYISSAFTLQYYDNNLKKFVDYDAVTDNTENYLMRNIEPVRSNRFRLAVTKPEQDSGKTVRLYQLNLYGILDPESTGLQTIRPDLKNGVQPVFDLVGRRVGTAQVRNGIVSLPQLQSGIYVVAGKKIRVR